MPNYLRYLLLLLFAVVLLLLEISLTCSE